MFEREGVVQLLAFVLVLVLGLLAALIAPRFFRMLAP